jgi:hypothetical protein
MSAGLIVEKWLIALEGQLEAVSASRDFVGKTTAVMLTVQMWLTVTEGG